MNLFSHISKDKRPGATVAGILGVALSSVLLLCGAGSVPIENLLPQGAMQGDLNAGGHSLTNVATITDTNGAPLAGGGVTSLTDGTGVLTLSGSTGAVTLSLANPVNTASGLLESDGSGSLFPCGWYYPLTDATGNLNDSNGYVVADVAGNRYYGNGNKFADAGGNLFYADGSTYLTRGTGGLCSNLSAGAILLSGGSGNPITAAVAGTDFQGAAMVSTSTPSTGGTVNAGTTTADETLYVNPSGTLATLTINLPSNGNSRVAQIERVFTTHTITALTVAVPSGSILGTAVTAGSANGCYAYQKVAANTWIRLY